MAPSVSPPSSQVQVTVQDAQLAAKWDSFFHDYVRAALTTAALDYPKTRSVTVPFNDLQLRDPDLADYLLQRPSHALRVGTQTLHQVEVPTEPRPKLHLRFSGLPDSQSVEVRALRAEHLGRFLAVEGLVKNVTEVRPMALEAVFECRTCMTRTHLVQEEELLSEPSYCDTCEAQRTWRFVEEECRFVDHQKITIQERPEGLRGGAQPERLTIHLTDDLVQRIAPGDRVLLNGILQTEPQRKGNSRKSEFNKVMRCVSIEIQEQEFSEIELDPEDEAEIRALAADPRVYDRLRESFAPTIYGAPGDIVATVKDALLLALFGGIAKHYRDGTRTRGDIHVLLVGDPGVAKSQLLRYLGKLAPRSIYTSGKGASAAGLTAAAVHDESEGRWTLEAGALVLADMGIACIDELDKMEKNDQSSMHQAMEQQEISISKAGVSATLKSRCAVIGAANPKVGRFDTNSALGEQIAMPAPLLSRFDLIFALTDRPSPEKDAALSDHILRTHQAGEVREHRHANPAGAYSLEDEDRMAVGITPELSAESLRKFVAYAKRTIFPVLTDEAMNTIKEYYVGLRSKASDGAIPLTARNLEAFVRLAEASARVRLSQEATLDDAQRAIRIVEAYLRSVGTDQETGKFDIDRIATGITHSQQDRIRLVLDIVKKLCAESGRGYAREEEIIREASTHRISETDCRKALDLMMRQSTLYGKGGSGTYAPLNP